MPRRPYLKLFLVSFLIPFLELAAIRFFGATVMFLRPRPQPAAT